MLGRFKTSRELETTHKKPVNPLLKYKCYMILVLLLHVICTLFVELTDILMCYLAQKGLSK